MLAESLGLAGDELGVGIGIDCGELSFGEFGRSHRDVTAIGTVVDTASRAQSAADADQILCHRGSLSARPVRSRGQPGPGLSAQGFSGTDRALCGLSAQELICAEMRMLARAQRATAGLCMCAHFPEDFMRIWWYDGPVATLGRKTW
jgi:class 3 adenylate cyclase